jgi:hypothetical protein
VETDERFVVINSIELEGITDTAARNFSAVEPPAGEDPVAPPSSGPTARGTFVSLRLDMAAYFRRPGAAASDDATTPGATR